MPNDFRQFSIIGQNLRLKMAYRYSSKEQNFKD